MNESQLRALLSERIQAVELRIQVACRRAGRAREDVKLVAVTKTVSAAVAARLPELGILNLGENRPQELWAKAELLPQTVRWHLIGNLQTNKIKRTMPLVCLLHAVDRIELLERLETEHNQSGLPWPVLLEVNASGEASKHGFAPEEIIDLALRLRGFLNSRICGLMTMAAFDDNPEHCRPTFALLRQLRDQLRDCLHGTHHRVEHLSMGMTNDFEVAIEEGATYVRIGSALFAGLPRT